MDLSNKSILITGGTGTLGRYLTRHILREYPKVKKVVIYSRDEQKQFEMAQEFSDTQYPQMRYFIGDVRDFERLKRALKGIDYVIHTAAMKHVPIAEYNPDECIKTNIIGAMNLIEACLQSSVERVVALSTDKACAPINLYGATKLVSDKLFVAANNIKGENPIRFSVVRYGNVLGSKGSVVPYFLNKKDSGILPITNPEMTRFNITIQSGVDMVMHALFNAWGGEIFIPKLKSYNILDLAKAISTECQLEIVGNRPGEKLHEEMISVSDSSYTYDLGKYYTILPQSKNWPLDRYIEENNGKKVAEGFSYISSNNTEWETIESLQSQIERLNLSN